MSNGWTESFSWTISGLPGEMNKLEVNQSTNGGLVFTITYLDTTEKFRFEMDNDRISNLQDCLRTYLGKTGGMTSKLNKPPGIREFKPLIPKNPRIPGGCDCDDCKIYPIHWPDGTEMRD